MDNDKLEPTSSENQAEGASECGPGCNCGAAKIGTKGKMIICLVVAIAAAIVLANSVMQKAETGANGGLNAFTAKSLVVEKASPQTDQANSSLWGKPLVSLAEQRGTEINAGLGTGVWNGNLNGFAIVWLKCSTNVKTLAFKSLMEAKEARLSSFRSKMLNHRKANDE